MNLLLIGLSRFAKRRVLPAASAIDAIDNINVATAHGGSQLISGFPKVAEIYSDWRAALDCGKADLVYVSLVNGRHAATARYAIERGHHVIVDKPAFMNLSTAEEMVALARSADRVIAEATCYSFHPMFDEAQSLTKELGTGITKVLAAFTPPVPADDFRHDRRAGGGAFLDTGPYMASLGRILWGTNPEQACVIVGDRHDDGLETSYSVLAGYPGGRTIVGQFGFTTGYRNSLQLLGKNLVIDLERPFSAPPDMTVGIRIESNGESRILSVAPADSMRIFLSQVLRAINTGSREFDAPLLSDARTLNHLINAASHGLSHMP